MVAGQTGTTTMAWYQDDVITMVTGDEAVARDYANAYFDTVSNS